ncbi:MAG TPA: hypothetical protein VMW85_02535 [Methanomassiliicoccales archaeon]|nr:hypothetical protein [Methanomassiliicoccales archaeon]
MQQGPYDPNQGGPPQYQGPQPGPQQWPQQNPPNQYQQDQPNQYQQGPNQQYQPYPPYQPPKKKRNMKLVVAAVAVVAILLVASMAVLFWPTDANGDDLPAHEVIPKIIDIGSLVTAATGTIGSLGGSISVNNLASAVNGLRIEVPQGALESPVDFDIRSAVVNAAQGLPDTGKIVSRMISIETDGTSDWDVFRMFDKVLTVTLPYDDSLVTDEEGVRFYQYDAENQKLEPTGFLWQDMIANTITFNSATFSKFVAVELAMSIFEDMNSSFAVDTGFRPNNDGWFIPNYGSYLENGGLCLGMVSYAKWYYTYHNTGDGLYDQYRQGDQGEWRDDSTAIELATRVQMGVQGIWGSLTAEERTNTSAKETGLSIIHGMLVSGEPQLVGLKTRYASGNWGAGGHAILAYKYEGGRFYMYDPNNPGSNVNSAQQQMPFTYGAGFTDIFKSGLNAANPLQFNVFYHASAKVFSPLNAYTGLYESAQVDFNGNSVFPEIELTDEDSDTYGYTPIDTDDDGIRDTSETKCWITGTISGGQRAVNTTLVFVGDQKFETAVTDGVFQIEVPLKQGDNDVVILATDGNTFTNWAGYYRETIESTAARGALTVTLSWGQGSSDVDLHVLEPYGRHIYYSNKAPDANAPYLDVDNTNGYGPEHYYATDDMSMYDASHTVMSNDLYGDYEIAVHYYADHDSDYDNYQPISWTVTISYLALYIEATGQEIWDEVTYSGFLGTPGGSGSAHSFASGTGWSGIMEFECYEVALDDYNVPEPQDVVFT